MLVLLELREKLQWLLVILCEKLNKMEISSLVKKEKKNIYIKKICSRPISPASGEHPRTAIKLWLSTNPTAA